MKTKDQQDSDKIRKTFIIDTNVLIHKPDALLSFKNSVIIIPLWVLEELDKLKSYSDEKSRNARHAIRFLDSLSKSGDLMQGVKMENGSLVKVCAPQIKEYPPGLSPEKIDNKIILTAMYLKEEGNQVFFVSKDINARVKATALGIKAVDYEKQKVNFKDLYSGFKDVQLGPEEFEQFKTTGVKEKAENFFPNEYAIFSDKSKNILLGRYYKSEAKIKRIDENLESVAGIKPLSLRQRIAFDMLLDDSISLVTLVGKAGTGKTLLAIATGLKKVIEDKSYNRVLVTRPVIPMGKDIGFLPGGKEEKLSHWMQPLFDNLDFILGVYNKPNIKGVEYLMNNKLLEIEALTYIRGRSLPGQYIIIDEAQNLSPHEVKTIVSRAGNKSKVVLTGDPYQIDSPYLDMNSNGLTYLVEAFKGQDIFGHVILEKSERSRLAELAAELL